jgi:hypothetical protein
MEPMKRLVFGEGLMGPSLSGEKMITLRKYRPGAHDFTQGEMVIGEFKDGLDVLLTITADTEKKPFSEITDDEARADGYKNAQEAFQGLKDYYPDLKKSDIAAKIRFEILKVTQVPVVSLNKYTL